MTDVDGIVALATPPGRSGVAVIRTSGAHVLEALAPFIAIETLSPRQAQLAQFHDPDSHSPLDQVLLLFFPQPHSFTGEDVVEIHCHGAPVVVTRILSLLVGQGLRPSHPGEFSQRAYLNGKMDLLQAEAVIALIESASLRSARQSARQLTGTLSLQLQQMRQQLLHVLVHMEASLDFSEEEIDPDGLEQMQQPLQQVADRAIRLLDSARLGQQLRQGVEWVIAGRPNVGKSSLFNRLAGRDKAIVTDIPGTTRDTNEHDLLLDGIAVRLIDTAGLRPSHDRIEQAGMERTRACVAQADGILLMVEAQQGWLAEDQAILDQIESRQIILVINKCDLLATDEPALQPFMALPVAERILCSCQTGLGMEPLLEAMARLMSQDGDEGEGTVIMAIRQQQVLQRLLQAVKECQGLLSHHSNSLELAAPPLRQALAALGELVGHVTNQELLQSVFSRFCIGK
ncbi:MAG: tRNA uridine-5-carboxymethylaminomethyl(34) synthesis GTPase MnmE [Magnetococcales bacterium]|nr:tRNA uridine-5-carboxymethylaminomethyl(34) synthesis GTPase MnmE [Magnetococcales bacterium]